MSDAPAAVDEYILHTGKRHPVVWGGMVLLSLAALVLSPWLLLGVAALAIELLGYSLSITNRRIIERRGLVWRRTRQVSLNQLASVDLVNRNVSMLIEVGTLTVKTRSNRKLTFRWVSQPERLVRLLDSQYLGLDLTSESAPVLHLRHQRSSLSHLVQ
jgi:uncharacterized membrane protein YdbT with pleckstrin-like domain